MLVSLICCLEFLSGSLKNIGSPTLGPPNIQFHVLKYSLLKVKKVRKLTLFSQSVSCDVYFKHYLMVFKVGKSEKILDHQHSVCLIYNAIYLSTRLSKKSKEKFFQLLVCVFLNPLMFFFVFFLPQSMV